MELRSRSVDFISHLPFDGVAIGGSIGGTRDEMLALLSQIIPLLDGHSQTGSKPPHLLRISDPYSLPRAAARGMDTFDSVFPTRAARHGTVFRRSSQSLSLEAISLRKSEFVDDVKPIDSTCLCPVCQHHSRAYLHHLLRSREPLFGVLSTIHNLFVWEKYMSSIREMIARDEL